MEKRHGGVRTAEDLLGGRRSGRRSESGASGCRNEDALDVSGGADGVFTAVDALSKDDDVVVGGEGFISY